LFSKIPALTLLQEAKSLIKKSGSIPVSDVKRELTRRKILKKISNTYYNNLFQFCQNVLTNNKSKTQYVQKFNKMLNFIESCDILDNCNDFIPQKSIVLSNISKLSSYTGNNVDLILLKAEAVAENKVILDLNSLKMLAFAKKNNLPVYVVASIFNIDTHSIYNPRVSVDFSLFNGIISEHGFEDFDSFIKNSRKSFNWLFF
jgi:hypothetical protein